MTNVLADLAIESEAATVLTMRLARAYDDEGEAATMFCRVVTPAAKFWICKRASTFAAEAMEVLGGNGYVEEFNLARIYREAPVNSIWEGSGNIMCLDVLRVLQRTPAALDILFDEMREPAKSDKRLEKLLGKLRDRSKSIQESQARAFVRDLVIALQASLLIQYSPSSIVEGFCASRLASSLEAFGMLPPSIDANAIVTRAAPALN